MANKPVAAESNRDREETYDEWFIRQVNEAVVEADKPGAVWHTHEEVVARGEARRAAIKARMQKDAND